MLHIYAHSPDQDPGSINCIDRQEYYLLLSIDILGSYILFYYSNLPVPTVVSEEVTAAAVVVTTGIVGAKEVSDEPHEGLMP